MAEPTPFKLGDRVMLKSGGPVMTVSAITTVDSQTTIECIWFDEDGDDHTADFPVETLKECVALGLPTASATWTP